MRKNYVRSALLVFAALTPTLADAQVASAFIRPCRDTVLGPPPSTRLTTAWAVAIRCAELADDRRSARLIAGGGIVADSEPLSELAETQAKFAAVLGALVRP